MTSRLPATAPGELWTVAAKEKGMQRSGAVGVAAGGLLLLGLTGCSLVGVPGLFLNAKSIYSSSPVAIPYTFNGPASSAWCRYTLFKQLPTSQYARVGSPVTRQLSSSGYLVVDVAGISGSSVVDGNYQLTFGVLSDSSSQYLIPTLRQTVDFSVQTGPYIQSTSPLVASSSTTSLTIDGWNLSTTPVSIASSDTGHLTVSNPPSVGSSTLLSTTATVILTPNFLGAYLTVSTGSGSSPPYFVPVEQGPISLTSLTPNYGSAYSSPVQIVIQGYNSTPYTGITFVDVKGNPVPFRVTGFSGGNSTNSYLSYFILSADLSHAALGQGSITLNPNDGTATIAGPLYFYIGG